MGIRIAINGFGRIGRAAFKVALEKKGVEVVALNDLTDTKTLAHLLQYDTAYGVFPKKVTHTDSAIVVEGKTYPVFSEKEPANLPWKKLKVDVVIESTGHFLSQEKAQLHIDAGAKRVVISAPPKGGEVQTFVMGVNSDALGNQTIVSNASCTTNCIAPAAQVLQEAFGIKKAMMTTIHSYTADQNLVDGPHKDLRRARAAAVNIVPTTTGAAIATAETIPALKGKFDGLAVRVPTLVGSLSDMTVLLNRTVTVDEVNEAFRKAAAESRFAGVMTVTEDPIVSSDIVGNPHASIIDLSLTKVVDGNLVKVIAWYDNEWGYSHTLVQLALEIMGSA
ncbi:MAG: type I glyceraldehyde-3-phosphate dehydrogenase [Candidatus Kerfeldbacteria bacterium]|nr:type I glyceraldehyde-3-phosphate dehydrogenase [Candidatus Kerfeldbacteria bacterium]